MMASRRHHQASMTPEAESMRVALRRASASTPDRDGRTRAERTSVLPTIISSSPGESSAKLRSRQPSVPAQELPRMHGGVSGQNASNPNTPDVLHLLSSTADAHLLAEVERKPLAEVERTPAVQQENYALRVARQHASPQQAVRGETQQASAESHVIEDGERSKRQRRSVTGVKTLTALDGDSYAQVALTCTMRACQHVASSGMRACEKVAVSLGLVHPYPTAHARMQFLEHRKSYKQTMIKKLEDSDLSSHAQEMIRSIFYPQTPDPLKMQEIATRRSLERLGPERKRVIKGGGGREKPLIFARERALYRRFQMFCRGSSMKVEDKKREESSNGTTSDEQEADNEGETGPRKEYVIDLKGFNAFMTSLGLIPRHTKGEPMPLQYGVALQCFKKVQNQGAMRSLSFPECKEVIYLFLRQGREMLHQQQMDKRAEIEELHLKIARMVPNSDDPLARIKTIFSQVFDSIFDAFIFFDVSGDWTLTKVEFIQFCKMLQLPLTPADLTVALSEQCRSIGGELGLDELDSMSFVKNFKWYNLIEKPNFKVIGYTVAPAENRLYQVFSWMTTGYKAERILEMIQEAERARHGHCTKNLDVRMHAAGDFGSGQEKSPRRDENRQADHESHAKGPGAPIPGSSNPKEKTGVNSQRAVITHKTLPVGAADRESYPGANRPRINQGFGWRAPTRSQRRELKKDLPLEQKHMFFSQTTKVVSDSSERAMVFQDLIEFLKVVQLIPVHLHRPGGKMKADLSSAEFDEVVRIFHAILGKEKKMEWPEFKQLLYELLSAKNLQKELELAEFQLKTLRSALARYAPSSDSPLNAFQDALRVRFDSSVDAFVFFDIQGDWFVTQAEIQNMIKRLSIPLSKPDLDSALESLFIACHGGGINANEFVRRLKWTKDDACKVKEVFDLYRCEKRLYNDFKQCCNVSYPQAPQTSDGVILNRDADTEGCLPGSDVAPRDPISRMDPGQEAGDVGLYDEPEQRDVSCQARMPFDGFEAFLRGIGLLIDDSSIVALHLEFAQQAFSTVNWADDAENVISWTEFKHVLHVYLLNVPIWLQSRIETAEHNLKQKKKELLQKVLTFSKDDPLPEFRSKLATRFDNVYDAFVFFDPDGDYQVTNIEMHKMLPKLGLDMTTTDLDYCIERIMQQRNYKNQMFVDPQKFVKSIAWHDLPSALAPIKRGLDAAKLRRPQTVQKAVLLAEADVAARDHTGEEVTDSALNPEDKSQVIFLERQMQEMLRMQKDFQCMKSFFGIPLDGSLAMEDEDMRRRTENARQEQQSRALQLSDKGISVLLDRARLRRAQIEEDAIRRSQDDVYLRKVQGFKRGAIEPPSADVLLKWVPKLERLELATQAQKVKRIHSAILRFQNFGRHVFGAPVKDFPMSTKEQLRRQDIQAHNRRMKKIALEGEHHIILDALDEAKLRRRQITERTLQRATYLKAHDWAQIEFPSQSVKEALDWFAETARQRILPTSQVQASPPSPNSNCSHTFSTFPRRGSAFLWGPMGPSRISAAPELMTPALRYRFPTMFDAWTFFDPNATWHVSAEEFRSRAALLHLSEEPVDVEGVIRRLDSQNDETIGPLEFVTVLKWQEFGGSANDMRMAFDEAYVRRKVVRDVALKRSRVPPKMRPEMGDRESVSEEVAAEDERQRREKRRNHFVENAAKERKLRELYGPPQVSNHFFSVTRQGVWLILYLLTCDSDHQGLCAFYRLEQAASSGDRCP